ncbi:MAG: LLM class flavin-dependent oxidoreductase, partial [Salaquimonas sp.]|nr:LLM class flavin-dependent oxidoreductase [Salaquimonas sp.]
MIPFSVLDLAPVPEGATPADALANTLDLAKHAEACGYHRYWMAEHHNMPGIASAATSVLIGHVAAGTKTIRVGAGGVMLPNHAPLVIAEQFGTLATLYPDRIDLGLGRAPGTDMATAHALRRNLEGADRFPENVVELIHYFSDEAFDARVRAVPGAGTHVPVWILGSSLYGAQLAAHLGLPYAFASHFAPAALEEAIMVYRQTFRPSQHLEKPRFMLAVNVFAADDDETGQFLRTSMQQAFVNLRSGRPGLLPRPDADFARNTDPGLLAQVDHALSVTAAGSPQSVKAKLAEFIERYMPDELILTGQIHDHEARKKSFEI